MGKPLLKKDMVAKTFDVTHFDQALRFLGPDEYISALEQQLGGSYKIRALKTGHEEGRIDYGWVRIGKWNVYFQGCGLDGGDDYLLFRKGTPKDLVDKSIAVLEKTVAEKEMKYFGGKSEEEKVERTKKYRGYIDEAEKVLRGQASYWNTTLKNYMPRDRSMLEDTFDNFILVLNRRSYINHKLSGKSPAEKLLVDRYLEWKHDQSRKSILTEPTFQGELKRLVEFMGKYDYKDFTLLKIGDAEKKELSKHIDEKISYYKSGLENPDLLKQIIAVGEELYPRWEKRRKQKLGELREVSLPLPIAR